MLAAVLVASILAGASQPEPAWHELGLPGPLRALLADGKWDKTPSGFRIVALSMLADGCTAVARRDEAKKTAALACVERCLALAARLRAPEAVPRGDGLWRSHYNLMLGARDGLRPCPDPRRHEALARSLAQSTSASPTRHISSYKGDPHRWPADQAATLASIARFDRAHGTSLAKKPVTQWRAFVLDHAMSPHLGLPWSEVTGTAKGARLPRGCALSWQTLYLNEFAPDLAAQWWAQYKKHYLVEQLGLAGFREWPEGGGFPPDADSGPIVQGIGASASAFGIAAARSMGDEALAASIERTAFVADAMTVTDPKLASQAHTVLAEAIRFLGAHLKR